MKKILFALMIVCILTLGVGSASAADDTLISYLKTTFYSNSATIASVNANSSFSHHNTQDEATVHAVSEYMTGYDILTLGYYNANAVTTPPVGSDLKELTDSLKTGGKYNIFPQQTGITNFGLYYQFGSDSSGPIIYSQPKFNTNQKSYVRIFSVTTDKDKEHGDSIGDRYIFCFDDGKAPIDYKDLIVELHPVDAHYEIPEFPTLALPVAAILGLMFVFGRKKEE